MGPNAEEMVGALVIVSMVVLVVGTAIAGVVCGIVSHRRAQRRGEITWGAVGLAARLWAWHQLVGYIGGALVLGVFVVAIVFFATRPEKPKPRATYWDPVPRPYTLPQPRR